MKYKVGNRVRIKDFTWYNKNKSKRDTISFPYEVEIVFTLKMSSLCGQIVTISKTGYTKGVGFYRIREDCGIHMWTDEMIEGFAEEENNNCKKCGLTRISTRCLSMDNCPHNKQRKFNVGDIVYSKTWQRNVVIHEILPDCVYKVGDLFSTNWFKDYEDNLCNENIKPTTEYNIPDGYILKDKNGNVINATEIVLEKKKKEYPKTYEECCRVLGVSEFEYNHTGTNVWYRHKLMATLDKLMLCRDAYWKIAGEEMGLGKPWKPDYDSGVDKYGIICMNGVIQESNPTTNWERHLNKILDFPTKEMRDAFYENFKEDIESCKELL